MEHYKYQEQFDALNLRIYELVNFNISLATKTLKIKPLCKFLQKMSAYKRDFDETNFMSFLIKGDELLENLGKSLRWYQNTI